MFSNNILSLDTKFTYYSVGYANILITTVGYFGCVYTPSHMS